MPLCYLPFSVFLKKLNYVLRALSPDVSQSHRQSRYPDGEVYIFLYFLKPISKSVHGFTLQLTEGCSKLFCYLNIKVGRPILCLLTLCLRVSSVDNLCKQFGPQIVI